MSRNLLSLGIFEEFKPNSCVYKFVDILETVTKNPIELWINWDAASLQATHVTVSDV